MITSSVEMKGENPILKINGVEVAKNAYITYFIEKACYDDFAKAGYKMFSVPLYFATRGIQEMNEIPPFTDGIFENRVPDFSIADRAFEQILEKCPDAYIFPRVNMSMPRWWEEENPDELCDTAVANPEKKRYCISSDKWFEDTKEMLGQFIDHIENSHYRDHVIGYQIAAGNAEEWIAFDFNGSTGKRSREKFAEYIKENNLEGTEPDYYRFASEMTAKRICQFCSFAKEKTNRRLITGAFYGYTFEVADRLWTQHGLNTVLKCDDVDFLCSPISYYTYRATGEDHAYMPPLETLKLHKVLYFSENDTRTHLTKPLFDIPHFHNPHYMPKPKWVAVENIKQHFARALVNSHALWWFDMGGGWYHYPLYMEMMKDFMEISKQAMDKPANSVAEVAVIIDEKSFASVTPRNLGIATKIVNNSRKELGKMGAPYARYLVEDYESIKDKYKAFILMVPTMTPDMKKIMDENPDALVLSKQHDEVTTDELREYLISKGVHLYSKKDAVIYVNESYLFLHTASLGKAELSLPEGKKLKQIHGDTIDIENDILPEHTGYLFEII